MVNIDLFLSKFEKLKVTGKGKWMACCPSHADSDPSLLIFQDNTGKVGVHCFAGCSGMEIMNAVGMSLAELYPDYDPHRATRDKPNWQARSHRRMVKLSEAEKRTMEQTLWFYEDDIKNGKKFTPQENKKYLDMYMRLKSV